MSIPHLSFQLVKDFTLYLNENQLIFRSGISPSNSKFHAPNISHTSHSDDPKTPLLPHAFLEPLYQLFFFWARCTFTYSKCWTNFIKSRIHLKRIENKGKRKKREKRKRRKKKERKRRKRSALSTPRRDGSWTSRRERGDRETVETSIYLTC